MAFRFSNRLGDLRRLSILAALAMLLIPALASGQEADLLVTKSGPEQSPADSDVTYTVTVFNVGPDDSSPVTLSDPLPAGLTFVSAAADPAFACATPPVGLGGTIVCTAATLAASASASFTFVFHIPPATPPGTIFVNIATVTSATDPNSENDSGIAATSTPPPPQADLSVLKSGPGSAGPDTDVVYTIEVTNGGLDDASNVTLTDTLPGTMTFVSVTSSGTPLPCTPGGTVTCSTPFYPAGGTTTITVTGHIPPGTPSGTTFVNTATVSTTTADPNPENDSSSSGLTVSSVDLSVAKQGPLTAIAGDPVSYALQIANGGPDITINAQLVDPLPPNTTFVSLTQNTGPTASCSTPPADGIGTVSCTIPALASSESADFTLVIRAGDATSITNTVSATSDSFDTDPTNDTDSVTTTIEPRADVAVTKNGPATAIAGTDVTYSVTVTNGGPSTATSVALTDTLPPDTTFVSMSQGTGPAFGCTTPAVGGTGTITCSIASFASGASAAFGLVLHLSPSASGALDNTANVSTATVDPDLANNASTASANVTVSADVSVTKSGPALVQSGSTVTYTLAVTNSGPSTAASVSLTDTLPAGTTFVSASQTLGPVFLCTTPAVGGTGTISCTIATLASGASATFNFVVRVSPSFTGQIDNTANATATSPDPTAGNGSATASTTVVSSIVAIPTLSPLAIALLGVLLALVGVFVLRAQR